jgi:hypothetical protein
MHDTPGADAERSGDATPATQLQRARHRVQEVGAGRRVQHQRGENEQAEVVGPEHGRDAGCR